MGKKIAKLRKMRLGEKKNIRSIVILGLRPQFHFAVLLFFFPKVNCLGIFSEVGLDTIAN